MPQLTLLSNFSCQNSLGGELPSNDTGTSHSYWRHFAAAYDSSLSGIGSNDQVIFLRSLFSMLVLRAFLAFQAMRKTQRIRKNYKKTRDLRRGPRVSIALAWT